TGKSGTYVAGVSTKARNIKLTAEKFNDYLKHDGVLDMLEERTQNNLLDQDAVESYQKHVKAIYQVGDRKTDDWSTILGYPIEFVPQENPYEKYTGEKLTVKLLLDGKPLVNQLVYADYLTDKHSHSSESDSHDHAAGEHTHENTNDTNHAHIDGAGSSQGHSHTGKQQAKTNEAGVVTIDLPQDGIYFIRTIYMVNITDSDELTHESKWATLTFEVTHKHGAGTHTHDHQHEEEAPPMWIFIAASIVIIGLLFVIFRKKS
ncbi:MAG: DUF4198 domain-containing protein, partial [Bacteroidota bacterium]